MFDLTLIFSVGERFQDGVTVLEVVCLFSIHFVLLFNGFVLGESFQDGVKVLTEAGRYVIGFNVQSSLTVIFGRKRQVICFKRKHPVSCIIPIKDIIMHHR